MEEEARAESPSSSSPSPPSSSSKAHQRTIRCTVYLDVYSVTCPGVLLDRSEDVYLSVCVMGQYRKTRCVPPLFPLRFSHKMLFVRMFPGVVDPADVSEQLESDTSTFELIQMVPPEGEVLATVEECTRDFVFPGPRLASSAEAPERQLLMTKSSSFPGIAPMVEFATTAVIEEMDAVHDVQPATTPPCGLHPAARRSPSHARRRSPVKMASPPLLRSKSPLRSPASPQRAGGDHGNCGPSTGRTSPPPPPRTPASPCQGSQRSRNQEVRGRRSSGPLRSASAAAVVSQVSGYQRPTVASVSRALSPYTHRRMCELSEEARARLGHLQLGPHRFRKQTESRPPFLVPCCSDLSESPSYQPVSTPGTSSLHRSGRARFMAGTPLDSSLLGSYRPKQAMSGSGAARAGGSPSSRGPLSPGNPSLQERFHSGPSHWEQIHSRVQRILQTHGTTRRPRHLTEEGEEDQQRTGGLCGAQGGHQVSQDRSHLGEWTDFRVKQTSRDIPRPHRAAFEESLGKIYERMYRKAYDNNRP